MPSQHLLRTYPTHDQAEEAASALRAHGIEPNRISLVDAPKEVPPPPYVKDETTKTEDTLESAEHENLSKPVAAVSALGGAVAAATGAALGAGALMVSGSLLGLIAPAGALGATFGGLVGYLVGKGAPREDLERLEHALDNQGTVLVVDSDLWEDQEQIEKILDSIPVA